MDPSRLVSVVQTGGYNGEGVIFLTHFEPLVPFQHCLIAKNSYQKTFLNDIYAYVNLPLLILRFILP